MKISRILCGAAVLILLLLTSCGNNQSSSDQISATKYPSVVVSEQNVELLSIYPTTIKGQEDIEIRPRIDGFIDAIYVDEGSVVKKGQVLFKINSPQAEQSLTTAQATLKNVQAQVNTAKINVDRVRPLVDKNIISNIQLITAEDSYQSALANLAQAQAALRNAQATLSWTNVTSPVDGLIGEIPLRLGSLVNSSNVLTTVANTGNVYAYFSLNEKDLSTFLDGLEGTTQEEKIKNIPELILTKADGAVYEQRGKIETITGSINIATGSASFRAVFPNKGGKLRSGTSGQISIPKHLDNAILIPQRATFAQQDKILVYQVHGDSVAQKIISVLPTPDGKNYVVTKGINKGDRIITDGIATLAQGMKITLE